MMKLRPRLDGGDQLEHPRQRRRGVAEEMVGDTGIADVQGSVR